MNINKENQIPLLGTLVNSDESGIIAHADQIFDVEINGVSTSVHARLLDHDDKMEALNGATYVGVTSLPTTGEPNTIYLVPTSDSATFTANIYGSNGWVTVGTYVGDLTHAVYVNDEEEDEDITDIDANVVNDAVRYTAQTKSSAAKQQARTNIGAVSSAEFNELAENFWDNEGESTDTPSASGSRWARFNYNEAVRGDSSIVASIADVWEASTAYKVGDIVMYDSTRYNCTTAHRSGSSFDSTKWTAQSVQDYLLWEPGTGSNSIQTVNTDCVAKGEYSVAEGLMTHAGTTDGVEDWTTAKAAHAEGGGTTARGDYSHAEGNNTVTNNPYEHAEGIFNVSNNENTVYPSAGNTIHSIGIGSNINSRKNAVEVMQNGDMYVKGVGGYDGTNPSDASSIQDIIANKQSIFDMDTIAPLTGGEKYSINGTSQSYKVAVTHGADDDGDITLTIDSTEHTVTVSAEDTPETVATAIAAITITGWTLKAEGANVILTKTSVGLSPSTITFADTDTTGVTATIALNATGTASALSAANTAIASANRVNGMELLFSGLTQQEVWRWNGGTFNTTSNWRSLSSEVSELKTKQIKLSAIAPTATGLNVEDIYYNTRLKKILRVTATSPYYEVIPFTDGSIYTYNEHLYVYNGSDLVVAEHKPVTVSTNLNRGGVDITYDNTVYNVPDNNTVSSVELVTGYYECNQIGQNVVFHSDPAYQCIKIKVHNGDKVFLSVLTSSNTARGYALLDSDDKVVSCAEVGSSSQGNLYRLNIDNSTSYIVVNTVASFAQKYFYIDTKLIDRIDRRVADATEHSNKQLIDETYDNITIPSINKYINLNKSVGTKLEIQEAVASGYGYIILPVYKGQKYSINVTGGGTATARIYAITDKDNVIVDLASNAASLKKDIIITNDGYLIINAQLSNIAYLRQSNFNTSKTIESINDIDIRLKSGYYNLSGNPLVNIGDTIVTNALGYGYVRLRVYQGEQYKITTTGNTASAKAYALTDNMFNVIEYSQSAVTGKTITIKQDGYLVVNSLLSNYSVKQIFGVIDHSTRGYIRDIVASMIRSSVYGIGNYNNEFCFDALESSNIISDRMQLRVTRSIPTNGSYIATDIYNRTANDNPTAEQIQKLFVPYLYYNQQKIGTLVLFDSATGKPFIFNANGDKINITTD